MQLFGIDLKSLIITLPIIIISLSFHEFMHAYVAYKMGDPTDILVAQNNRLAKMENVTRDDLMQILPDDVLHARGKIDE